MLLLEGSGGLVGGVGLREESLSEFGKGGIERRKKFFRGKSSPVFVVHRLVPGGADSSGDVGGFGFPY